jgi:DNA-binding phage protein
MSEIEKLKAELATVRNLSSLARLSGVSRRHLYRVKSGETENLTMQTVAQIKAGLKLAERKKAAA